MPALWARLLLWCRRGVSSDATPSLGCSALHLIWACISSKWPCTPTCLALECQGHPAALCRAALALLGAPGNRAGGERSLSLGDLLCFSPLQTPECRQGPRVRDSPPLRPAEGRPISHPLCFLGGIKPRQRIFPTRLRSRLHRAVPAASPPGPELRGDLGPHPPHRHPWGVGLLTCWRVLQKLSNTCSLILSPVSTCYELSHEVEVRSH